jgi:CheY-like chemotaxis protein
MADPTEGAPERTRVLYLDDDDMLASIVELLLKRRGYEVRCYADASQALDALRATPKAFDVVLTDFNMPQLSGLEVAERIAGIDADLPVVLMSGLPEETIRRKGSLGSVRRIIYKPDAVEPLIEAIEAVLAEEGIRRLR